MDSPPTARRHQADSNLTEMAARFNSPLKGLLW